MTALHLALAKVNADPAFDPEGLPAQYESLDIISGLIEGLRGCYIEPVYSRKGYRLTDAGRKMLALEPTA